MPLSYARSGLTNMLATRSVSWLSNRFIIASDACSGYMYVISDSFFA